jgi:hypothetical protein
MSGYEVGKNSPESPRRLAEAYLAKVHRVFHVTLK